ncbi:MAG: glycosyltransferase family 9 protein [Sulfurifustis sp.]
MAHIDPHAPLKFLVIRRDNIGDLICTTPVFAALRERFPRARIYALTNTYNLPVLRNNPFVDESFAYMKLKHREPGVSIVRAYWERARLVKRLRSMRIDYVILAGGGFLPRALATARLLRPQHIVGYVDAGASERRIDLPVPFDHRAQLHEVEYVFKLLAPLGIVGAPPPLYIAPGASERGEAEAAWKERGLAGAPIGVHISARKSSNRWPTERFVALMRRLHAEHGPGFMLFWSPGEAANPRHPGDDAKAREILNALPDVPVVPFPTQRLDQLIAGLSVCDRVICSDGGAMHIAAALRKPILCFFGNSGATRWRPWGTPHVLLQPDSLDAGDISVDEAFAGFQRLLADAIPATRELQSRTSTAF